VRQAEICRPSSQSPVRSVLRDGCRHGEDRFYRGTTESLAVKVTSARLLQAAMDR
jgi:hypothetical protein